MKQIFVGSTQRLKLHNEIGKAILSTRIVIATVLALLLIIPISFAKKIFVLGNGEMSPVVYIETSSSSGSAVYIGNNYFITAAHVVDDLSVGDEVDLEFRNPNDENDNFPAKAILLASGDFAKKGKSPNEDYALLCIQNMNADDLTTAYIIMDDENSIDLNNEETSKVTAIGYPNGRYSKTSGNISNKQGGAIDIVYKRLLLSRLLNVMSMSDAKNLADEYVKNFVKKEDFYVVTGAKIWHGNSGGALIHTKTNKLVGITNMEFTETNVQDKVDNDTHIDLNADDQTFVLKIGAIKKGLRAKGFQL